MEDPGIVDSNLEDCLDSTSSTAVPQTGPKWRAMFYIFLNHQRKPVLGDTGCTTSCMSYRYYVNNPYLKRFFTPRRSCGMAINGSDVESIGEVSLKFHVAGVPMSINCKVTKGLMDPVVLACPASPSDGCWRRVNGKVKSFNVFIIHCCLVRDRLATSHPPPQRSHSK